MTGEDVRVNIIFKQGTGFVSEAEAISRPTCGPAFTERGLRASVQRLSNGDFQFSSDEDGDGDGRRATIDWKVPRILPGERIFSKGCFLVGAKEPTSLLFDTVIKAHNLAPRTGSIAIRIEPVNDPSDPQTAFTEFYDRVKLYDTHAYFSP